MYRERSEIPKPTKIKARLLPFPLSGFEDSRWRQDGSKDEGEVMHEKDGGKRK
jgi:hypothetical protein